MYTSRGTRPGGIVLVSTLGFDEKFAVRCLMRNAERISKLVVITAPPLDEYSKSRLESAWSSLKKVAEEYASIEVERLEVASPEKFWFSTRTIRRKLYEELAGHEELVLCLSGGLRALVAETLIAAVTLPSDASTEKVAVEIELENLSGVVRFNIAQIQKQMQLTGPEHQILEMLEEKGSAKLSWLASMLGKPRTTVYRMLQKLEKQGLVVKEPDGTYRLP